MKSVLLSIQPKWCELIASGKKTIEIRKTRPKIETPFKCYIYETKGKTDTPFMDEDGHIDFHGRGQIIGEFICDEIINIKPFAFDDVKEFEKQTCLNSAEIVKYLKGFYGYGWHISDLVIYDKPKELSEFYKPCTDPYQYCQGCDYGLIQYPSDVETYEDLSGCCFDTVCLNRITRPPQSWCYVEELEG